MFSNWWSAGGNTRTTQFRKSLLLSVQKPSSFSHSLLKRSLSLKTTSLSFPRNDLSRSLATLSFSTFSSSSPSLLILLPLSPLSASSSSTRITRPVSESALARQRVYRRNRSAELADNAEKAWQRCVRCASATFVRFSYRNKWSHSVSCYTRRHTPC